MKFARLTEYFEKIETTSLRNEMMEILAKLIGEANSEEVGSIIYLALGRLKPKYDKLEFSLAEKMVVRAIALAERRKVEEISIEYKQIGDLGEVVNQGEILGEGSGEIEVEEVYLELVKIAKESGQGSQERKVMRLAKLIKRVGRKGGKYVVRMVLSKLRLGFSDKTVLDALSYVEYGSKEGRKKLDEAYQRYPDVGEIARIVKDQGVEGVSQVKACLGTPIVSALAQRLKTADEMIEKMGEVVVEAKFDGQRVQIHFSRNKREESEDDGGQGGLFLDDQDKNWIRSYTRNLDENSSMFPELKRMGEQLEAEEVILDSEAVGYDPKTGKMLPFQKTITRKRKHGVGQASEEVPLKFHVFDVMYRDGQGLLEMGLRKRREILKKIIKDDQEGVLVLSEAIVTEEPEELREYHRKCLKAGLEGAMVKKVDGKYLPGRQDYNWVKFKESEDSAAKLSDTLDLVVMGYYKGKGKRAQFEMGALLVGIVEGEKILTIAKIGTGFSDQEFVQIGRMLKKIERKDKDKRYQVEKSLVPDVWVEPELVIEVAADEVTVSPSHTAGVALRFPRLIRVREDKDLSGVTTMEEVKEIGV